MKIRVNQIIPESIVDGPGIRYTIFFQGCERKCQGCHNPQTWDPNAGTLMYIPDIINGIKSNKLIKGVTISGGEPFDQLRGLANLISSIREINYDIILYTGHTLESLMWNVKTLLPKKNRDDTPVLIKQILMNIDYLVEGEFIEKERSLKLKFRGSSNQNIIDMAKFWKSTYEEALCDW